MAWSNIAIFSDEISPPILLLILLSIYWATLSAIGVFSLFVSILTRNLPLSMIIGVTVILLGFLYWKTDLTLFVWTPTAQMYLVAMYPNTYSELVEGLSVHSSFVYNLFFFLN